MKNIFFCSLVFCSLFFTNFAFAKCLSSSNKFPECRYPEGDSWCAERSHEKKYAYSDKCLETLESRQPQKIANQKKSKSNLITIFGINIEMSETEISNEMSRRGFSCEKKIDEELVDYSLPNMDYYKSFLVKTPLISCAKGNKIVGPRIEARYGNDKIDTIAFNCSVFNTCGLTLKEAAKMLVDSTNVKSLNPKRGSFRFNQLSLKEFSFCGSGPLQDRICIFDSKLVEINRGNYGSATPSYR